MKPGRKLRYSAAFLALMTAIPAAQAETVTTQTYIQAQDVANVNKVNFSVFDTNKDGIYSMQEVGARLFESFDRDNNGLIDNIEWDQKTVMTITPMEQEEFTFVDYDNDGVTDKSVYTYQTFYQASGLIGFDDNQDGLSASEFIDTPLLELDKDGDKLLSLKEWEEAYKQSRLKHNDPQSYN